MIFILVRNNVVHEKNCSTCQFNCGVVCCGYGDLYSGFETYGVNIDTLERMFPSGCSDYRISFSDFQYLYDDVNIKE